MRTLYLPSCAAGICILGMYAVPLVKDTGSGNHIWVEVLPTVAEE
jgi:hypothetical protein